MEVDGLTVFTGAVRLVGPISFRLDHGAVLVVMGETGAGKSLLAQAILGALPRGLHATGRVSIGGQRVDVLVERERAALWGRRVALLPQEPWRALDPLMRVAAQVSETHRHVAGLTARAADGATAADFSRLQLTGAENRLPGALSGGMAQRVAFAAAKAGGASIVFADEPTKGLDADRRDTVVEILSSVARENGALLAITHEAAVAQQLGGDALVLKNGAVVEQGRTVDVLERPKSTYAKALIAADPSRWPRHGATSRVATNASEPVLSAESISVARGDRTLVSDFTLSLRRGERIAICGPSGSGKTSLLDALAGLLRPLRGAVHRGAAVGATGVQKLYQDPPAAFAPRIALGRSLYDVAKRHDVDWSVVDAYLSRLRIGQGLLSRRPDAVSGGELQRIALARVLIVSPVVLLADEPTSRLDPITQASTMDLITEVAIEQRVAVALVTHDAGIADNWAQRRIDLA